MDILKLAKKVTEYIFPYLSSGKAVEEISKEISEATNTSLIELWNKIKPIFIEEFEEKDSDLENPAIVAREIKKYLNGQRLLNLKHINELIQKLESKKVHQNSINSEGNNNIVIQDGKNIQVNINKSNE